LLRSNQDVTKSIRVVDEMDPNVGYVPLFDLALLRPFSIKADKPLTEGGGTVASTSPPTDKPMVGEPTMNEMNGEMSSPNTPEVVPVEVKPVEEKPMAPLTMETLSADVARMSQRMDEIMGMMKTLTSKSADEKAEYPWDECIADKLKNGYSQDSAEKICGAIRSRTVGKDASKADWDAFLANMAKGDVITKSADVKTEAKADVKPCGCPEVKKDASVVVAPTTTPAIIVSPPVPVVVETKVEAPVVETPAPVVAKVEPVIVQPAVEVKAVPPIVTPTEPVIIQRGKSIPDKSSAGLDLASINKMSWDELNRLRRY
jgi:hypothetical protein